MEQKYQWGPRYVYKPPTNDSANPTNIPAGNLGQRYARQVQFPVDFDKLFGGVDKWWACRIIGYDRLAGTYTITGPGGVVDYENPQTDVLEEQLATPFEAVDKGWISSDAEVVYEEIQDSSQPVDLPRVGTLRSSTGEIISPSPQPMHPDPLEIHPQIPDLFNLVYEVFNQVNMARHYPDKFADKIVELIQGGYKDEEFFDGSRQLQIQLRNENLSGYHYPNDGQAYKADVEEAITFLRSQTPLPMLIYDLELSRASLDLAKDTQNSGHTGGDGSRFYDRMRRYGSFWSGSENLGSGNSGFGIVSSFIIDWKNPDRGHRKNIFDPKATHIGIGCHYHAPATAGYIGFIRCVQNFAVNWIPKDFSWRKYKKTNILY